MWLGVKPSCDANASIAERRRCRDAGRGTAATFLPRRAGYVLFVVVEREVEQTGVEQGQEKAGKGWPGGEPGFAKRNGVVTEPCLTRSICPPPKGRRGEA